jgi:aromatic amino acid aminotransferase I
MAPPAAIEVLPESDTSTFTLPDRLTIQGVAKRRAVEGRLIAGVAAVADVERFKGRTVHAHKAKARRWDRKYPFGICRNRSNEQHDLYTFEGEC